MDAFISGAWRSAKRAEVYISGGWRKITRAEAFINGAWRSVLSFAPPMTVSVSPSFANGVQTPSRPQNATITSNSVQATPSGGTPPYRYSWIITAGDGYPTAPNNALTAFAATLSSDEETQGGATVTCTDAMGVTATGQCSYYLYNRSIK